MEFIEKFSHVFIVATMLTVPSVSASSAPGIQWQKSFGADSDDYARCVRQTSDGGFIVGGYSASGISGNKTSATYGDNDYWVIKLDSNGNKVWEKSFGGSASDQLYT